MSEAPTTARPLAGTRVLDMTLYGPGPYCAMLLGDMGAEITVVDNGTAPERRGRRDAVAGEVAALLQSVEFMRRGARRIALDLRHPDGQTVLQRLVERADVLLEGFRPGVATRLGLDPETLRKQHPRLIYCSISGYGQEGPYRTMAGHDINYLALGGLLGLTGRSGGPPVVPGTLVADLAGGGLPAAVTILGALLARERTGEGQYIDVSVQEGVAALIAPMLALFQAGQSVERGRSLFTGAAPWYGVYETRDGEYLAVGAIEPWFWAALCERLGHPEWAAAQSDRARWSAIRAGLEKIFRSQPRDYWTTHFDGVDACVTPVWSVEELLNDPQLAARGTVVYPEAPPPIAQPGANRDEVLAELGFSGEALRRIKTGGGVPARHDNPT